MHQIYAYVLLRLFDTYCCINDLLFKVFFSTRNYFKKRKVKRNY